jgi:hypothetical protein
MLHDELMQGTTKFIVQEDGTETIEVRPPTARELRAGRQIKRMQEELNNLMIAYNQLRANHDLLVQAVEAHNAKNTNPKETTNVDTGNPTHQADPV